MQTNFTDNELLHLTISIAIYVASTDMSGEDLEKIIYEYSLKIIEHYPNYIAESLLSDAVNNIVYNYRSNYINS